MTQCAGLSDRMPTVAAGRSEWSGEELAHLEACPDCRAEWALVQTASTLGTGASTALDADRVSARVMARLRSEPAPRPGSGAAAVATLLAAAAIALVVWTGRAPDQTDRRVAPAAAQSALLVPELDRLSAGELTDVLEAFDGPLSERSSVAAPTLGDLSDHELERVLRAGGV